MWWKSKPKPERPLRDQLEDAREDLIRQIAIMQQGPTLGNHGSREEFIQQADALRSALDEVEAQLVELDPEPTRDEETPETSAFGAPAIMKRFAPMTSETVMGEGGVMWVRHTVMCRNCLGGDLFTVISQPKVVPNPSPDPDRGPGDTVYAPPYTARCVQCRGGTTFFDPQTAGYAAVLRGRRSAALGPDEAIGESRAANLYITLAYGPDLDALKALAADRRVPAADLFQVIHVFGRSPSGAVVFDEVWDCSR
jgi:hypothetical protein